MEMSILSKVIYRSNVAHPPKKYQKYKKLKLKQVLYGSTKDQGYSKKSRIKRWLEGSIILLDFQLYHRDTSIQTARHSTQTDA